MSKLQYKGFLNKNTMRELALKEKYLAEAIDIKYIIWNLQKLEFLLFIYYYSKQILSPTLLTIYINNLVLCRWDFNLEKCERTERAN